MPWFVDWDKDQAVRLLEGSGVKSEIKYTECSDTSLDNKVVEQSVKRGSMMKKDSIISLTVYQMSDQNTSPKKNTSSEPSGSVSGCEQKLIVTAAGDGFEATAELMEFIDGEWKSVATYDAAIGKNGIGTAQEGSNKTPQGSFRLGKVLVKDDRDTKMDEYPVTMDTGFVSDVESEYYNQLMEKEDYPEGKEFDLVYEEFTNAMIIIEFNGTGFSSDNVIAGGGSAIGLRGKADALGATFGDVDISAEDMDDLLSRLDQSKNPMIVIGE